MKSGKGKRDVRRERRLRARQAKREKDRKGTHGEDASIPSVSKSCVTDIFHFFVIGGLQTAAATAAIPLYFDQASSSIHWLVLMNLLLISRLVLVLPLGFLQASSASSRLLLLFSQTSNLLRKKKTKKTK